MIIQEIPKCLEDKTFTSLEAFLSYVYDEQIITEIGELESSGVNEKLATELENAKQASSSEYINI